MTCLCLTILGGEYVNDDRIIIAIAVSHCILLLSLKFSSSIIPYSSNFGNSETERFLNVSKIPAGIFQTKSTCSKFVIYSKAKNVWKEKYGKHFNVPVFFFVFTILVISNSQRPSSGSQSFWCSVFTYLPQPPNLK